ncbi:MAG: ABC transporter substrate-binding protein, partial [Chloroflexota bacterium]
MTGLASQPAIAVRAVRVRGVQGTWRGRGPRPPGGAAARAAAVLVVALLVAGCGSGTAPSPLATQPVDPAVDSSATAAPPSTTPAPALGTPAPAYGDTLTIGWSPELDPYGSPYALYGYRNATDAAALGSHRITLGSVVYSGLYRFDARFNAVPDLADGPCVPQGDGTVIRCRLVETTFHDGTPVTADDVTYSFRLLLRPAFSGYIWSVGGRVEARVVDQRTVDFVLATVDPTFLTEELPWIPILPRHAVEAAYAAFSAATRDLKAADLTKLADDIDEETGRDPPVCTTRLDEVDALLPRIGFPLYREDFSRTGTFDACAYMRNASGQIRTAAAALGATGIDAVADAYWCLSFSHRPIGAGPYRLVSQDADRIHLEAWPGYHGGPAATRYVDFVPARGDGTDVLDGSVDIYQVPTHATLGAAFETTASARGVRIATPPGAGYEALQFNVRPGRLFADVELRKALQLCVDLPRDVDAATGGAGTPVYGPLMPGTWAYDPSVPQPARDVAAARALIENAGWTTGADGVYAKDGIRLAAVIPVRGDAADRVKMADLIAAQARDCGMDLRANPV